MSRPASSRLPIRPRTPAHEHAVRDLRLAQATIEKLRSEAASIQGLNDILLKAGEEPIQMRLHCPECGELHVDEGEFATRAHSTHTCQHCGACWKPCLRPTVGVRFLPGTKNER